MESRQLEKCIHYILKCQNISEANYDAVKAKIRAEYEEFVTEFFRYISKNKDIVKTQYK